MAHLQRSVAALRISGEQLIPAEVTRLLGSAPSHSYAKGDKRDLGNGRIVVKKLGLWSLQATDAVPENLDAQVAELLGQLSSNLDVWRQLAERFDIDLFCGWFMGSSDEGVEVAASTLHALGERGIKLGVCVYAPDTEA